MTLDELVLHIVAELRAGGYPGELAQLGACRDDYARAGVLYRSADTIRPIGRATCLRFAGAFASHALRCRADGWPVDSEVWRERSEAELERYRGAAGEVSP